jgi:adenosine deaminase
MAVGSKFSQKLDDLLFFNTTISEEYRILKQHLGFTYDELKRITLYAVEGAFLPDEEKTTLRREIERGFVR